MNFCSNCGSDQLAYRIPEGDNRQRFLCTRCQTIHYSNPRIVTGCLVTSGEKVLLCRRSISPRKGFWNIPGGYLENGESVQEGAAREVYEEALAEVHISHPHTIFSIPHINQVYIHFMARLVGHHFAAGPESLEVALFDEADIPWSEMAFESSVFSLKKFLEDRREGREMTTHFGQMAYSGPESEKAIGKGKR